MRVEKIRFQNFRNLEAGSVTPSDGVNVFYGDNAQGKTNLLEAIWLFTGSRSFRGAKDRELCRIGEEKATLSMDFFAGNREQTAHLTIETRRKLTLNGVEKLPASKLAGIFCGIVFSPSHLSLIKDGPEGRRRFMDAAYCQLRPAYLATLAEYNRVLTQRNAVLKNGGDPTLLSLWDEKLALIGSRIYLARQAYIGKIQPVIKDLYNGLSGGSETLEIGYLSDIPNGDKTAVATALYDQLCQHRAQDLAAGFTTTGVHREDFAVTINGLSAKTYGSQGQQRSAVLSLKLAEAAILKKVTGEQPIALLDDVMSELDVSRQDYILNHIEGWQVFITCCEPSTVLRLTGGKAFAIKRGVVTPM